MISSEPIKMVFFGGEPLAVPALTELEKADMTPQLIVTNPDRRGGRGLAVLPPPAKVWAEERDIPVLQPESLRDSGVLQKLRSVNADIFVVVAYSKIFPRDVLEIPKEGALNMHPSLLPKYRGPSPIRSAILHDDRETGVTIILMDEEMDHGPILAQKPVTVPKDNWPMKGRKLDALLAETGGKLLAETILKYLDGSIEPQAQEHKKATYTKKIERGDGAIDLAADDYQNFLKIQAYDGWPGMFFFAQKNGKEIRVKVTDVTYEDGQLTITRVIPEGKKEMRYADFIIR